MTATASPDLDRRGSRVLAWLSRATTSAVGLLAILWVVIVVPDLWVQVSIGPAVSRIIAGDSFSPPALEALARSADAIGMKSECFAPLLRSSAIIGLRRAETAITDGNRAAIDVMIADARGTIRRSLGCAPADPFLWFAAFWLENNLNGFRRSNIEFLRMSYELGPNEGWIALRRNRVALALYDQLPADLQQATIHEYLRLLQSNFITDAVDIFLNQGRLIQGAVLAQLEKVPIDRREFFALLVRGRGYEGEIPSIPARTYPGSPRRF